MISCKSKKIGFIVDSTSCIKQNQYDDVYVVPLCININNGKTNKIYRDTDKNFTLDFNKIIKQKDKIKVTTAQTPITDMIEACEIMSKKYDEIYVLPINRCLSSCIDTWKIIEKNYPKINVIQYKDFCIGLNWDIPLIKHNFETTRIDKNLLNDFFEEKTKNNRLGFAIVNDISWLMKGGRLGLFKGSITKILGLKPMIFFNYDLFIYHAIVRNYKNFFDKISKYLEKNFPQKKINKILVLHNNNDLEITKKMIQNRWPNVIFEAIEIPIIFLVHTGPNIIGIYFDLV